MVDTEKDEVRINLNSINKIHNEENITSDKNNSQLRKLTPTEKYIEDNLEIISELELYQMITKIISFLSLIIFILIISIKVQWFLSLNTFLFCYILIPAYIGMISLTLHFHYWLSEKEIFDKAIQISEKRYNNLGNIISFACLYISSICCLVYITLLTIRMDNFGLLQNIHYNIIGIPFYIFIGSSIFYYLFMLPAFIVQKMHFLMVVLGFYITAILSTFIMINLNLDGSLSITNFSLIFFPFLIAIFLDSIYGIVNMAQDSEAFKYNLIHFLGTLFLLIGNIITVVILDKKFFSLTYIPVIFYLISILCFFTSSVLLSRS